MTSRDCFLFSLFLFLLFWRVDIEVRQEKKLQVLSTFASKPSLPGKKSSTACIIRNAQQLGAMMHHDLCLCVFQIHILAVISCTGTFFFSCTNTNLYLTSLRSRVRAFRCIWHLTIVFVVPVAACCLFAEHSFYVQLLLLSHPRTWVFGTIDPVLLWMLSPSIHN